MVLQVYNDKDNAIHLVNIFLDQLVNSKTIAESSSTYNDYVASRAVDGISDQNVSRCFHSNVRKDITEAWLRIDLRRLYSVKSVKLWFRGDSKHHIT